VVGSWAYRSGYKKGRIDGWSASTRRVLDIIKSVKHE